MRIVAIIQARLTSTRLPHKVHMLLGGMTVLDRVREAASRIPGVSSVHVAWPGPHEPEEDVLARYARVARELEPLDGIVRLTADCPLLDPHVSGLVVLEFLTGNAPYASNIYPRRTWPDGLDTEVFTPTVLYQANQGATTPYDREHVTPWIQRNHPYHLVELPVDWSHIRLTLDTPEDLVWLEQCLHAPRS